MQLNSKNLVFDLIHQICAFYACFTSIKSISMQLSTVDRRLTSNVSTAVRIGGDDVTPRPVLRERALQRT